MSLHHEPQQHDAIAFQLAAAVEAYEEQVDALLARWPDMERYRAVSEAIDEIRLYSATLPHVSVQFVALLIAHAELMHALWKGTAHADTRADAQTLEQAREQHGRCAAALRQQCMRLLLASREAGRNH